MSRDPYLDVKGDVEANLSTLQELVEAHTSHASPDIIEELQNTIGLLDADIEDLDESVRAVEQVGDRWGISDTEKRARRDFVERVKRQVETIRRKVTPSRGKGRSGGGSGRYTDDPDAAERGRADEEDSEEARRWEMEEQQQLVRRQDDTLGVISGTLHSLASQAGLIGTEVAVQSEMLDDLGDRVDSTDSRLKKVSRTMQDFIRRNEETKSGYCICILIIVLIVLLVAIILT